MPARTTQRLTRLPVWSMIGKRGVASVNKHFKNLTFPKLFFIWFTFFFVLLMINMQTIKSGLLASVSGAVLGVFLLIFPIPPRSFQRRYGPERAVQVTRVLAVVIIVISFLTKIKF